MGQLIHAVRGANWLNIVIQCIDRSVGTSAKQYNQSNKSKYTR